MSKTSCISSYSLFEEDLEDKVPKVKRPRSRRKKITIPCYNLFDEDEEDATPPLVVVQKKNKQVKNGQAFEWAFGSKLADILKIPFDISNKPKMKKQFDSLDQTEQDEFLMAAEKAAKELIKLDPTFKEAVKVITLSDKSGRDGDVRDIVVVLKNGSQKGISCKNNHDAMKHSRLSDLIDVSIDWFATGSSGSYINEAKNLFKPIRDIHLAESEKNWRDYPLKKDFYRQVLTNLQQEILRQKNTNPHAAKNLFNYWVGKEPFYKIVKINETQTISIQFFDVKSKKLKAPEEIRSVFFKKKRNGKESDTTIMVDFDRGWLVSLRVHNANEVIEPSLKLDIQFEGVPKHITRQSASYKKEEGE